MTFLPRHQRRSQLVLGVFLPQYVAETPLRPVFVECPFSISCTCFSCFFYKIFFFFSRRSDPVVLFEVHESDGCEDKHQALWL